MTVMMNDQEEEGITQQPPTPLPKIDKIDIDGDIEFVLPESEEFSGYHLIVSSKVLSLASSVFKALFSPQFHEGSSLRDATLPFQIELQEDDGAAMSVICQILHHQIKEVPRAPQLRLLCAIAQSADKWDCIEPLRLWSESWLRDWRRLIDDESQIWSVLVVAYRFDIFQAFCEVTSQIVKSLPRNSNELDTNITEASFPENFMADLRGQMETVSNAICHEIELAVVTLQDHKKAYPTRKKVCDSCGRTLPEAAKRCHPCDNTAFGVLFCNTESRIAFYFEALRKVGLWPLQDAMSSSCIDQVASKLSYMPSLCPHSCEGNDQCPIKLVIVDLIRAVRQKQKSACGLCLDCLKSHRQSRRDIGSVGEGCRIPHQTA